MDSLFFLVEWNKTRERTWSGTPWGLYCSLQKHFEIIDIDTNAGKFERLISLVYRKISHRDGMGLLNIRYQRFRIKKMLRKNKGCSKALQFSETLPESPNIATYIYIDEDVNHVKLLYEEERETFKKSNFNYLDYSSIKARNKSQVDYLEKCAGVFTMGAWLKESLIERLALKRDKVHHVGGGINLNVDRIDYTKKERKRVLFIGRDFERKGGPLVVEAFKSLHKRIPDIELHIAGPIVNPLIEQIENVFFYGDCTRDKISDLMNLCDVFCMPSYYEAYGLVFIEALTYGLPCIGRNAYEMPYFIENNKTGLLIDEDDSTDLSNKMERLLTDSSFSENVRAKRDWYIKKYSWEAVATRIASVIK